MESTILEILIAFRLSLREFVASVISGQNILDLRQAELRPVKSRPVCRVKNNLRICMFPNKMESADSAEPLSQHYQLQQQTDEDQDLAGEVTVVSSLIRSSLLAVHISTEAEDEEPRLSPPADIPPQTDDLPPADPASNSNFNNSCCSPPQQTNEEDRHPHPPPPDPTSGSTVEPPRKKSKGVSNHGSIEVTLEGKSLWDEFYCRGTEMIVNRAGRRVAFLLYKYVCCWVRFKESLLKITSAAPLFTA